MRCNPVEVAAALRDAVLHGYDPYYSFESGEDHWADWTVLPPARFEQIKDSARNELQRKDSAKHAPTSRELVAA